MKAMIIGAAGFVGPYLAEAIKKNMDCDIVATKLEHETVNIVGAQVVNLNILNVDEIKEVMEEIRPDYIFHLAAQSSVGLSWKNPVLTVNVNIIGAINVLDCVRNLDYKPRILVIGSGEEYGRVKDSDVPISEDNSLNPGNIYAATKVCQNMIASIYASAYDMDIVLVRAFNHIGPGQIPQFVVADFCSQVARIEKGEAEPVMRVGNLAAKRDFTDVRDVVRAYVELIQKGKAGETYNVGSGKAQSIQSILDVILSKANVKIDVEVDPAKLRPIDVPIIEADITKLQADTGWKQEYNISDTIDDTLKYWRNNISNG